MALADEIKEVVPLPDSVIHDQFLLKWEAGDVNIDLQLASALQTKDADFTVRSVPILKTLIETHLVATGQSPGGSISQMALAADLSAIEKDSFSLLMKQLRYDLQCFCVWEAKSHDHESAISHQKHAWKVKVNEEHKTAASHWISAHSKFIVYDNVPSTTISEVQDFQTKILAQLKLDRTALVSCLALISCRLSDQNCLVFDHHVL